MPKVGMQPIRRRQLIEATIRSMGERGFADTTVRTISDAAGVSPGIIQHYFGGKDQLLAATMRSMMEELRMDTVRRLAGARSHHERLAAVIDSNFATEQFAPGVVNAWLAFWAQVPHVPALAQLQRINVRRLHSNLLYSLRALLPAERAETTAHGMGALIDGVWLRSALTGEVDARRARALLHDYLALQLDTAAPAGAR
ncbi:transcriptional regulator BetI [Azospirillum sp. ST 5-10]|uniref:transcriptional regulator BetI n=1 Tax=unclassified Azospirillum TaxID=2630922 RepID=UPI003F49FE80